MAERRDDPELEAALRVLRERQQAGVLDAGEIEGVSAARVRASRRGGGREGRDDGGAQGGAVGAWISSLSKKIPSSWFRIQKVRVSRNSYKKNYPA